jgi:dihydrofolate reductase
MGQVRLQLSISLDGFGAGRDTSDQHLLGVGGERLHEWVGDETNEVNDAVGRATFENAGAIVIGRTMFGVGLKVWSPDTFEGMPVFVPTHHDDEPVVVDGGSTFTYVTAGGVDGADSAVVVAVNQAKAAAGDADVVVFGGPTTAREALALGLIDELRLQVAHVLLGEGERLFESQDPALAGFERVWEASAPGVTHVTLRRTRQD